jgi:hypothetical protein
LDRSVHLAETRRDPWLVARPSVAFVHQSQAAILQSWKASRREFASVWSAIAWVENAKILTVFLRIFPLDIFLSELKNPEFFTVFSRADFPGKFMAFQNESRLPS